MTRIALILSLVLAAFNTTYGQVFDLAQGDKAALLMVHFGTTYDDTRMVTIDAINAKAREAFPEMRVEEAYTSRIVMKRLAARGIVRHTPREMLLRLAAEGYTHVFVQGTNVIDGIESESLRDEVAFMAPFFKDIRVGRPLLYSVEDCAEVVRVLAERYAVYVDKNAGVVLIGHGTDTPATAIYSQIDYMFSSQGHPHFHVATVEGYPDYDTVVERLKADKVKSVTLVPFMFVAGDHARNDIDSDWREKLGHEGYKVKTIIEGLGQIPAIQDIYIDHIRAGLADKPLGATQRKNAYILENL